MKMTAAKLKGILDDGGVYMDTVGKNKQGDFVVRKAFFSLMGERPSR
jgi:hypothetical protein